MTNFLHTQKSAAKFHKTSQNLPQKPKKISQILPCKIHAKHKKSKKPHKNHAKNPQNSTNSKNFPKKFRKKFPQNPLNHLKFRPFVSVKSFAFENYISGIFPSGVLVDINKVKAHIAH